MIKLRKPNISFYLQLLGAILAVVTLILGLDGGALSQNRNFGIEMIAVVALFFVTAIAPIVVRLKFWALVPAVCSFVAFGLAISGGAAVIVDKINNISFVGGNFTMVVTFLILLGISCILSIAACFVSPRD